MADFLIVGSGPAGLAAASGLVALGRSVVLADVGLTLEADRQQTVDRFARLAPEHWDREGLELVRGGSDADANGLALKRLFGSNFPYDRASDALRFTIPEGSLKPSFALGGLSNVWGAVILPYNARDLEGWPVRESDLADHYRAVAGILPCVAVDDGLTAEYPLYTQRPQPPLPSRQAARALAHMERHRARLGRAGIRFGTARVAMRSGACVRCGVCLQGCPYDLIYNARQTLDTLRPSPHFAYRPGLIVRTVEERGNRVVVRAEDATTRLACEVEAGRVLIAVGVIPTARIVLESLGWLDRPLRLIDSQYSVLPLLALRATPGVAQEPLHTLCQIFLEVSDPSVSRHNIHCQLYTYNSLFQTAFAKMGRGLVARAPGARTLLLSRLMVALCYLHSDDSGTVSLWLEREAGGGAGRLVAEPRPRPETAAVVRRLARVLFRHTADLGFAAVVPAVHVALPGRGFHTGGSFPMRENPGEAETDTLGRLSAWRRVHLVDASVFPSIPASTITYTAMANAHRIAHEAARLGT